MHTHTKFHAGFDTLSVERAGEALAIDGALPSWLTGALLRTGPAMFEVGKTPYRHWFDGLATLHRFDFGAGAVVYSNRFLRSAAFSEATRRQTIALSEFATSADRPFWRRMVPEILFNTTDNGNVNVVAYGANDIVALTETPLPVRFDPKTLATRRAFEWSERVGGQVTTAHPQYDSRRRMIYNYEIKFGRRSVYRVYKMAPGSATPEIIAEIPTDRPAYMHSFAMSERFLILTEFPLVVHPMRLLFGGRPFIESYRWSPERGLRFTVLDKDTGAVVKQATTDACFAFHHVNAFEEDGTLAVDLVAYPDASVVDAFYLDRLRNGGGQSTGAYARFRIPLGEGAITRQAVSDISLELPRIHYGRHAGRKHRYVWAASQQHEGFFDSIVKYDVETGADLWWSEPGTYPGEPVFVPTPRAEAEDQGVLLSVVLDGNQGRSFLVVLDAATLKEIARASVPHAIPFGFHGNYFAKEAA